MSGNALKLAGASAFAKKFVNETKLSEADTKIVQQGIKDAFEKSGAKKNGYELLFVNSQNAKDITEDMVQTTMKRFQGKIKPIYEQKLTDALRINLSGKTNEVSKGLNAYCHSTLKKILLPDGKLTTAGFHEIGHAMNSASKLGKFTQGPLRIIGMLAPLGIALFGAFSKKQKAKEGEELTTGQKASNFVRNNAGKLSFLAMTPILIEEGVASIRGNKLAKEVLSKTPELAKKVSKSNRYAWCTYLCAAAAAGITSFLAVKIKDKIQDKKNQKAQLNV